MENFIVSARKYRPTTFDSVVGQHSITATLKNAIKSNHLAQAFLFCGPRGVGKTTCARILAKTINCFNITENIEACNECESCKAFDEGHSLNIHELDGASNNSVDDIRGLIDQVRFAPQVGTHKVYIIDEVHMLSQAAFNAFLKTLEEPPKHAIFILATTEKHKIIPTILSRCQIFDFNRIQVNDIAQHLVKIASSENVPAEQDGLHLIAQKADGALRDALSMFDQIVSFSGGNVTYQAVVDNLNILDYTYYFKVTEALLNRQVSQALLIFNEILNKGFNGHNFINGLAEHFRNLLVCQDQSTVQLLEVGDSIKEQYLAQAGSVEISALIKGLEHINEADTKYKGSKNQRLLVEVLLMRLCSLESHSAEKKKTIIDIPFKGNESSSNGTPKTDVSEKPTEAVVTTEPEPVIESTPAIEPSVETEEIPIQQVAVESEIVQEEKPLVETQIEQKVETSDIEIESTETNPALETLNTEATEEPVSVVSEPKVEEKITEKPNVAGFAFADSISINPTQNDATSIGEKLDEIVLDKRPEEAFTDEEFLSKWKEHKGHLEEQGRSSLASLFDHEPKINGNSILVAVENKVLLEEFQEHMSDFLSFMRESLNNYAISVETEINQDLSERKAYTPQEKFVKMAEKNPSLKTLVKKLDMDVGYA